jgi:hypothetical protein
VSEPATGLWALNGAAATATEVAMANREARRDIKAIPEEKLGVTLVIFLTCINFHAVT